MKKIIVVGAALWGYMLLPEQGQAQGMIYLSNFGLTSGVSPVGSNNWVAVLFTTGTNTAGYTLDSIQFQMGNAAGNTSGFRVMLYNALSSPTSYVLSLDGSSNPYTNSIYSYTPSIGSILSPNTLYAIVVAADFPYVSGVTPGATGFTWIGSLYPHSHYGSVDGWSGAEGYYYSANFGSSWSFSNLSDPQYAINATLIPEPDMSRLLGLGSFVIYWIYRSGSKRSRH